MRSLLAGAVVGVLALGGLAGLVVVSSSGKSAEQHAQGFVDPAGDQSLQLRFDTWKQALDEFKAQPLGRGVGTVGSAAVSRVPVGTIPADLSTTDNSFLKVLVEQGILGWPLFVLGVLGTCGLVIARAWRAPPRRRAFTLVALCGFASFPLLWLAGEYIEQPGKVLAWLLLGIAVGEAFRAEIREAPKRPASG
jgi:O-antigen ligase